MAKGIALLACAALSLQSLAHAASTAPSSCVSVSSAKYEAKKAELAPFFATGSAETVRVIVGFKKKLGDVNIAAMIPGARVIHKLDIVNSVSAELPASMLAKLASDPNVRVIELDGKVKALNIPSEAQPVNDPVTSQVTPPGITRVGATEVWSQTRGNGVKVAVVDTGIDKNHPDLAGRVIGGKNFTTNDANDWADGHGHGTHVSGTVAANDNTIGVVGVAPEASLVGVRVLDENGSGTFGDVIAGVNYTVEAKVDVANMSLGGTSNLQSLHDAVKKAHEAGVLIAAAAGNSGDYSSNPPNYPGAYPEVVGVAAVDDKDMRAYFSTYNKFVGLAGPGVNVLSLEKDNKYAKHSGTSMAAPHVAGVAALLKSVFPNLSNTNLKRKLVCNAEDLFPTGRDSWTGHGIVNAKRALSMDAQDSCSYLRGEVTEPVLAEPVAKPDPSSDAKVAYVKVQNMKLVNDGQKKQLLVTVQLTNAAQKPLAGVKVTSQIMERKAGPLATAMGTTNSSGEAQFVLSGFSCGKFIARVAAADHNDFSDQFGQPEAVLDLGSN